MKDGLAETKLLIQNSGHRIEYRQQTDDIGRCAWKKMGVVSVFTVAKTILEVLTVLQELNVIRSALLLLCLELQQ